MKEEQKNLLKIIGYIGFFVILICIARMSLNKTEIIKEENNGVNYIKSIIDMSEDFYKMNIHYVMDDDAITLDFEKQNDILIGEKYYHKVVDKFVNYNNKYYVLDNDNFVENASFDSFPYDKTFIDFKNLKELAIENVNGFEMEKIDKPLKIEKLSLMGIDKLDLNILSKYKNLNEISIYDNDIEKVRENLKELRDRKIKIMLNGIYEYKE